MNDNAKRKTINAKLKTFKVFLFKNTPKFCVLGFAFCVLSLSSCKWKVKPTYPADRIAAALRHICAKEYRLRVETRCEGNTLQAFFWRVGLLKSGQMEMRNEAAEALERVLLCATRIALSSDAPLQFIEVRMADVLTGATVTLWRYVPDIRDSMYTRLAEEEYINRLVIEVNTQGSQRLDGREPHWDKPLTMREFLAKQVVLRVKRQSPVGLQAHEDLSQPNTLAVVVDNWPLIERQGAQQKDKVAEVIEKAAQTVIKGYKFNDFHGLVLEDGRGLAVRTWKL